MKFKFFYGSALLLSSLQVAFAQENAVADSTAQGEVVNAEQAGAQPAIDGAALTTDLDNFEDTAFDRLSDHGRDVRHELPEWCIDP